MKKYISLFLTGIIFFTACTKNFQEINSNPNSPIDAPETNILAWSLENFANGFYGAWVMSEPETYAGHLGKIQYVDESRYMYSDATVTTQWNLLYHIAINVNKLIESSKENNSTNMEAVAMTLQAFVMWMGTDTWRDLPYSQAIRGDSGYIAPAYDTQEDIYPAIIKQLSDAADLFAAGGNDALGDGDLLFNGNVTQWQKLCNSLRLRIAMRISNIDASDAKSIIEEIMGDQTKYPVITDNDDNAYFVWQSVTPYQEPWYVNSKTRDDHGVGQPMVDSLVYLNDPRLSVYVKPASTDGAYRGIQIGVAGVPTNIGQYSRIGARFRDNPSGFSPFINASEVELLLAEASVKGWNTGGTSEEYYKNGITLSLEENGISTSSISEYLNDSKILWDGNVQKIYRQEWITLYKNGIEGWANERRTDYPLLPAAPGSPYEGHSRPPFRYPYPASETNLNKSNSSQFVAEAKDNFWGKQMWWDTRKNVL